MEPLTSEIFHLCNPGMLSWIIYVVLVGCTIIAMLAMSRWVGEKRQARDKDMAYECGLTPTGNARFIFPATFYLVAVFFLIFDIESAFIFQWAIAARDLGVFGWIHITLFVAVLLLSLFYVWAKGGLAWGKRRHPKGRASRI